MKAYLNKFVFDGRVPSAFDLFSVQTLIFPVVVVLIVALTFLFGGAIGAWQWWTAVLLTSFFPFLSSSGKIPVRSNILFAIVLFSLWMASGMFLLGNTDELRYHQPAIRMMIEGWNPVWHNILTDVGSMFGLDLGSMRIYHVVSMPHGAWYFNAAAYAFCRNPFSVMFVILPTLFLGMLSSLWRQFEDVHVLKRVLLLVGAFAISNFYVLVLDSCIAVCGVALIVTMWNVLRTDKWLWLDLIVFSFWMCVLKQPSCLHCFIFWVAFACVLLYKRTNERRKILLRLSVAAMLLASLFTIVCASPYLSSWRDFGHPLYSRYSGKDEWPPVNITDDFLTRRNADAASMSHCGAWLNAFVSPSITRLYYRIKTRRQAFAPRCGNWEGENSPLTTLVRYLFIVPILLLLIFGRREDRFVAMAVVIATMAIPTEMIGYKRYVPWLFVPSLLLVPLLARTQRRSVAFVCATTFFCVSAYAGANALVVGSLYIYHGYGLHSYLARERLDVVYPAEEEDGNAVLLKRQDRKRLSDTRIVLPNVQTAERSDLVLFYGDFFKVKNSGRVRKEYLSLITSPRSRRAIEWLRFISAAYFIKLPKLIVYGLRIG